MKKKIIIIVVFLLLGSSYFADAQNLFQKHFISTGDDRMPKIALTPDNGHLIYYQTTTNSFGNTDLALMKINQKGEVEWSKHFGENKREIVKHIIPYENNYLICAWLNQYGMTDDIYLAIIDANGNTINKKYWGESLDDEIQTVVYLGNGKFAFAGETYSHQIHGLGELIFSTFDENLNMDKVYVYSSPGVDIARKIIEGSNSGFFIAGYIKSSNNKALTMRIDKSGNLKWATQVFQNSLYWDMIQVNEKDIMCVGEIDNYGIGGNSAFITKFDSIGNLLWAKTYSFEGNSTIYQIKKAFNENLIVVGKTTVTGLGTLDVFFIEIDPNGNFISGYTYGCDSDDDWPYIDYCTADSGFSIIAETKSFDAENTDLFLINTDNSGNSCCAKPINNLVVNNVNISLQDPNLTKSSFNYHEVAHNLNTSAMENEEELLCYEPVQILGRDTIFCDDSSNEKYTTDIDFLLDLEWVVPPTASIINNINDTTVFIDFAMQSGMIYLLSTCNDTLDSLYVFVEQSINLSLGNDTLVCGGQAFYLNAGDGFDTYLWQDGSTDSTFLVTQAGNYWVQVENSCGLASDTIHIDFSPSFDINIGNDTSFCYGHTVLLEPGGNYYSYFWQDGSTDSIMPAGTTGHYWVIITDSLGCTAIDSVYIEANMEFGFSLGSDTSVICDGDYIFLHGPNGYQSYLWQDGSNYLDLLADTAGIYWLEVTDENACAARDSMLLIVNKVPDDFLGNDTVMCDGDYFDIHAPSFYDKYLWQDGSTDSVFIAWQTGNYWVYVEDSIGCNGIDSISIASFQPPLLNHSNDTLICPGDNLLLSPGGGMNYYLWNTGSSDSAIIVQQEGEYWVDMGTVCGLYSDSVVVGFYTNPDFYLGPDTNICNDESIFLRAGSGFADYLWSDDSTDSILIVTEKGDYSVLVNDGRCILGDTIVVETCSLLWVPNVFTPNDDGFNDDFFAVAEHIEDFKMTIFNRWGQILKTLNSIDEKWDGSFNGYPCPDAVYYWEAAFMENNRESETVKKVLRGSVTLIRAK